MAGKGKPLHRSTGIKLINVLREAAEIFGNREALVVGRRDQVATFTELNQKADIFAGALVSEGVQIGDRVAIWMTNSLEWVITFFAIQQIGAIAVPINTRLKAREVTYVLRKVEAKFLVMQDQFLGKIDALAILKEVLDELEFKKNHEFSDNPFPFTIVSSSNQALSHPYRSFEEMMRSGKSKQNPKTNVPISRSDPAAILFTSGTTSFPKGVMLTHNNLSLLASHVGYRQSIGIEDRFYSIAPFFHCAGLMHAILTCLTYGVTLFTTQSYQVDEAYDTLSKERCTVYHGYSIVLEEISKLPRFKKTDFTSFRAAWYSAPAEYMANLESRLDVKMCELYGLTETGGNTSISMVDDLPQIRHDSDGHPHDGLEIKIINPKTREETIDGTPGEICIRGWNVMKGYYGDAEATSQAIDSEGWLHTGDQGVMFKKPNLLKFLSRIKDIIRVGGENFAPPEVEEFLMTHPAVLEASVVGIPDARLTEVPVAFVKITSGASIDPEELIAFSAPHIANFKVPRHVFIVDDFPRTQATLRIQKNVLREWAVERLALKVSNSSAKPSKEER